jgi:hypothetical protein
MNPIYPKEDTQEAKVLNVLQNAQGDWINKQFFVRDLFLTQAGRAIWNLENRFHWKIEHSDFKDDFGFKSYRILSEPKQIALL